MALLIVFTSLIAGKNITLINRDMGFCIMDSEHRSYILFYSVLTSFGTFGMYFISGINIKSGWNNE